MQALSKRNDDPAHASRPVQRRPRRLRHGRGRRVPSCSRPRSTREARGAKIYAERRRRRRDRRLVPHHRSRARGPRSVARGARSRSSGRRIGRRRDAHQRARDLARPTGDIAEYKALLSVFGDRVHEIPVSATKASTGHLLGGTGALEAIFTILALRDRQAPPDDQPHDAGPRDPAARLGLRRSRSATGRSSRSATRSASAGTTPSSRSRSV